jgi:GNAT superfamily N-acetyltransferase
MKHRALSWDVWESFNFTPGLRLPSQLNLDQEIIDIVKNIGWSDLDWEEIGSDGVSVIWLKLKLPVDLGIEEGVVVDIQLINDIFYQIHISLAESLRGIGLGTKIYRSLIDWAGHLYSGKGRRHNPIVNKVWRGLENDPGVTCLNDDIASICISNKNPDRKKLSEIFNRMTQSY